MSYEKAAAALERRGQLISAGRLITFLAIAVLAGAGFSQDSTPLLMAAAVAIAIFAILVVGHARLENRRRGIDARADVYARHLKRVAGGWQSFADDGDEYLEPGHAYARDIDLVGAGSLFQRIDVSHTRRGARTLAHWLGKSAEDTSVITQRQAAVRELADATDLREDLEAAVVEAAGDKRIDETGFLEFIAMEKFFATRPWMVVLIHLLPLAAICSYVLAEMSLIPWSALFITIALQLVLLRVGGSASARAFDLIAARRGYLEAFQKLLLVVERAQCTDPLLQEIQSRTHAGGRPPSAYFRRLDRWAGMADLRTQFPLNIIANALVLWDLHVLYRLERWNAQVGAELDRVFGAIGEFEALCSLATLACIEGETTMPEIVAADGALSAEALAHPLLAAPTRVPNDVQLQGPTSALLITGSNMAGKSTLLRSVGLGVALGLAGGPVTAKAATVPRVRLRASMRAEDSLQQGASYFRAELSNLESVIGGADDEPRILFLLDELLRGTNARARHLGARAIMMHLLSRRASGLVATHDAALADLEAAENIKVTNLHFTDVMLNGEMTFDYLLRPGVVKTSNALQLLRQAGVDVPDEDMPALESSS